ncbi:MAG: tetratricopeptide repeat protein, partial [Flavobacteriales bacterium]
KLILDKYPNPVDQREALKRMKDLYQVQDKVDDWVALMKQYNLYDENKYAADTAYFENAENFYQSGEWANAIKTLDKYLQQFNPAHFALQAHFYLADSYVAKGEPAKSLEHFEYVIKQPSNIYTSHSILSAARIYLQQKNKDKAKEMYLEVEKTGNKVNDVAEARLALMNIYKEEDDLENAAVYAEKVLADQPKDDERKAECHYIKGKSAYRKEDYTSARTSFDQVIKLTKSEKKGEAGFLLCEMRYISAQYKQTEKELYDYFKQKPSYSYWLAKGYILLAMNYAALGDTTQAKATIKSVMDNYKKADDDILSSAQNFLDTLTPVPSTKSGIIPEGEIQIENGEQTPEENKEPKNE